MTHLRLPTHPCSPARVLHGPSFRQDVCASFGMVAFLILATTGRGSWLLRGQNVDAVSRELPVATDNHILAGDRLCDEQSIKWVSMMPRQ